MKIKKTLYNWLTNRFLLIIRNEENFAEKRTFSFNYAKLIVFGISLLIVLFTLFYYLNNTILYSLTNPEYNEIKMKEEVAHLYSKVDSLSDYIRRQELFGHNIHKILTGNVSSFYADGPSEPREGVILKEVNLDSLAAIDIQLRKEIEEQRGTLPTIKKTVSKNQDYYLLKPLEGVILTKYDQKNGKFGLEIATKSGEIVKSIAEGSVIFANYSSNDGYVVVVQHKQGFISVYKNNTRLLKNTGDFVNAGESVAVSGSNKQGINKNQLHFELWKDGNPVNPEYFISF